MPYVFCLTFLLRVALAWIGVFVSDGLMALQKWMYDIEYNAGIVHNEYIFPSFIYCAFK